MSKVYGRLNGGKLPASMPARALPPKEIFGTKVEFEVRPKLNVTIVPRDSILEQDGKKFVMVDGAPIEVPAGHVVVADTDKPEPELLDVVFTLYGVYGEPNPFAVRKEEGITAAKVSILELARVDYCDFKRRGKAVLSNVPGVPGFTEQPEPWAPPAAG